jgi:hypothetical protein
MLKNPLILRPLKKVRLQGGLPMAERDVREVRRSECQGKPTPQKGLFRRPVRRT